MKKIIPKNKNDLINIINDEILINGKECNLNHIDTSQITEMSELFKHSEFNGDISNWDTSEVRYVEGMFAQSKFNKNISKWNMTHVKSISHMFWKSCFNGDISNWNLISLTDMVETFKESKFTGDLSKWILDKLIELSAAFDNFEGEKPWWNIEDNEKRQETIVKYHLMKKLEKNLVTNKEINKSKKTKI